MKIGSIGEIPPRTRGRVGCSALIACPAAMAISEKSFQSGSISGSQCDLLFGSFQIIAASIMESSFGWIDSFRAWRRRNMAANVNFGLRVTQDGKAGAAKHGFDAGCIRSPPVGRIVRVSVLDEV